MNEIFYVKLELGVNYRDYSLKNKVENKYKVAVGIFFEGLLHFNCLVKALRISRGVKHYLKSEIIK